MGAYGTPDVAIAGLLDGFPNFVDSAIAQEDIAYGAPVFGFVGAENKAYAVHKDKITTLLDADLVTSNVITSVIQSISVATTFASTHAATMTAHIAAINAKAELVALGISAVAGATNRGIVISGPAGLDLTMTQVVTLGATQATATITYGTNGRFLGVAVFVQNGGATWGAGNALWVNKSAVNILREGKIWVPAEATVADKDAAYAVLGGSGTLGKFTDVATNNYNISTFFRSNVTGGLALLEVQGMK